LESREGRPHQISPRLEDSGNLALGVTMTRDITPEVGQVMALVPCQGMVTPEGKPLKNHLRP